MNSTTLPIRVAIIAVSLLALLPFIASAQAEAKTSLRDTVESVIKADPRAAEMTEAQIDSMADMLTAEAQAQGVSAADILWRPTAAAPEAVEPLGLFGVPLVLECGDSSSVLCQINRALGLDGTNLLIPLALGIGAALMLLVLALLIVHHKHVEPKFNPPPPLF